MAHTMQAADVSAYVMPVIAFVRRKTYNLQYLRSDAVVISLEKVCYTLKKVTAQVA